jgi:hypothetical protein
MASGEVDDEELLAFLKSYHFSSLPDYLQMARLEKVILNPDPFPEYFETAADHMAELKEWLLFEDEDEINFA